ncbi:NrtR DNA-binding winged helix domain-containing protein [Pseudonocardia spirodelae]|uniref:NrtR DNA-binding winged helix domain-containing protein n=1 Tax=Pseudonocardia spirodelae TaxID=3133431 RepID=A0ABU8T790_9PSEU
MIWRDEHGKSLADHERPSVAVDVALLTLPPGGDELGVVLHERTGGHEAGRRALPGTFLHVDRRETLRDAALRALRDKVGVTGREPRQLRVFDAPDRDPRGRVLSVAHVDVVPFALLAGSAAEVVGLGSLPPLPYDHDDVVAAAVAHVRDVYRAGPDPLGLAGEEFTLLELQTVHQAVLGTPLQKDTFRRHVLPGLADTGRTREGTVGKPARTFRRR